MEAVQRWSVFGDYTWGILENGIFYPFGPVEEAVVLAVSHITNTNQTCLGMGLGDDLGHFCLDKHPSELPTSDPRKFTIITPPKPVTVGRYFREDE